MRHYVLTAVGILLLMAGNAFAGEGGCNCSRHAAIQSGEKPVLAATDQADSNLSAKVEEKKARVELEKVVETPFAYN